MSAEELEKGLKLALAQLDRQYGKNTVIHLGSQELEPWPAISTGSFNLDLALGIGGLPRGRIVEIFGNEGSGKTSVALSVIAQAQKEGGNCLIVDVEQAIDPSYAQALGVDLGAIHLAQPASAEEALDIIDTLIPTGALAVVVLDSVAALAPLAELEGEMGDQQMALQARLMGKALRKLVATTAKTNTLLIFINQLREKVGFVLGNPEITPGGRALKFYSSVRLQLSRLGDIKDDLGYVKGSKTRVKIVKNKLGPPFRKAEFELLYGKGINELGCIVEAGLDWGVLERKGPWISLNGESIAQGFDKMMELLASDLDLADRIKEAVRVKTK